MNSAVTPDPIVDPSSQPEPEATVPPHVAKHLIHGTSALGLGVMIERGMGFLANILAARFGGASTFGTYSLAITTAMSISTYAAGGIGATAARFSGKYPRGGPGYSTLARVLLIVSVVSAALAALGLLLGAAPIAHLLHKDSLTTVLRWAAFSSAGIILLECARGFFVGQRRLTALILLSVIVGIGMVTLLPLAAAAKNPIRMIICQGAITTAAVMVCLSLARPLGLLTPTPAAGEAPLAFAPMLKEVWSFGLVQLAGLIGINLAGWWVTSLVARSDTTLVQISFLAIANQLRNIVGLAPSLLTESSYSTMSDREGPESKTPDKVMAVCTFASTAASLLLSAIGILIVPWGLSLLYGKSYGAAAATTAIALAIAVVHMGNAPAAARLTILSIRTTGVINTIWAIFVGGVGTAFLLHGGSAWKAMVIYLAGHVVSAAMVLIALKTHNAIPRGMMAVVTTGTLTSILLALMAFLRSQNPQLELPLTGAMFAVAAVGLWLLFTLGSKYNWLPSRENVNRLTSAIARKARGFFLRESPHGA